MGNNTFHAEIVNAEGWTRKSHTKTGIAIQSSVQFSYELAKFINDNFTSDFWNSNDRATNTGGSYLQDTYIHVPAMKNSNTILRIWDDSAKNNVWFTNNGPLNGGPLVFSGPAKTRLSKKSYHNEQITRSFKPEHSS